MAQNIAVTSGHIPKARLFSDRLKDKCLHNLLVHVALGAIGHDVGHTWVPDLPLQQGAQLMQLLLHLGSQLGHQGLKEKGRFRWGVNLEEGTVVTDTENASIMNSLCLGVNLIKQILNV